MKPHITIDANAFLRLFLNDIPGQVKKVEELLEKGKKSSAVLHVPQIVIFEVNFTLEKYYHFSKSILIDNLKSIIEAPYLEVQDRTIFNRALKLYADNNVSLEDCFNLVYSLEKDGELFTFDENLKRLIKEGKI